MGVYHDHRLIMQKYVPRVLHLEVIRYELVFLKNKHKYSKCKLYTSTSDVRVTDLCGSEPRFFLTCREAHAEDRPSAASLHVLELHVAEDESGRGTVQVRKQQSGGSVILEQQINMHKARPCN